MQAHLISMENKYNANQLQQQYQRKVIYHRTDCFVNLLQTRFISNRLVQSNKILLYYLLSLDIQD